MNSRPNPYVGPRSFRRDEKMFGRAHDVKTLLHLFVAERIVLLYSPSGAGKTSLLQAAFIPRLRERGFSVLSGEALIRVSTECPLEDTSRQEVNRYVLSALLSLEEGIPAQSRRSSAQLAQMTMKEYLDTRVGSNGGGSTPTLIFDQFEEILTLDPTDVAAKSEFFEQLGDALEDQRFWTLFSMREEYRAALDPYRELLPTRLHSTFRLDFLPVSDALKAMREPVLGVGVGFSPDAARRLVDDLRRVKVQKINGPIEDQLGPYVEPVQLQVVCHSLWEGFSSDDNEIGLDDVEKLGNVDSALSDYYGSSIRKIADETTMNERQVRDWVEKCLISDHDLRTQVLLGEGSTNGLNNRVVDALKAVHLVRAEERGGRKWLELAHDRLVTPVKASNKEWRAQHLSFLAQCADLWVRNNKAQSILLQGEDLKRARQEYEQSQRDVLEQEKEFLAISETTEAALAKTAEREERISILSIGITVVAVLAAIAFFASWEMQRYMTRETELNLERQTELTNKIREADRKIQETRNVAVAQLLVSKTRDEEGNQALGMPLLLAAEANQRVNISEVRSSLLALLAPERHLISSIYAEQGTIRSVAISADRRMMAASGITNDNYIWIWDLASKRKLFKPLSGHSQWIPTLAFSPSGKRLVSGSADGNIIIWDTDNGSRQDFFSDGDSIVSSVTFLDDGDQVVFSRLDGTIGIWDSRKKGKQSVVLCPNQNSDEVYVLTMSSRGLLASGGKDRAVSLWDLNGGKSCKRIGVLKGHESEVFSIAFSPDGTLIATGGAGGEVIIWNTQTRERQGKPLSAGRSTTSDRSRSGSKNLKDGKESAIKDVTLPAHSDQVFGLHFDLKGKRLISASTDKTIRIWDVHDHQNLAKIQTHQPIYALSYYGDDLEEFVVTGDAAGNIALIQLEEVQQLGTNFGWDDATAFDANLTRAALSVDEQTYIYEIPRSQMSQNLVREVGKVQSAGIVVASALSPDGKQLALVTGKKRIEVWNTTNLSTTPKMLEADGQVRKMFLLSGGKVLYLTEDGKVVLQEIADGSSTDLLKPKDVSRGSPIVAVSGDDKVLALYDPKRQALNVLELSSGKTLFSKEHVEGVESLAVSASGELLAYYQDLVSEGIRNITIFRIADQMVLNRWQTNERILGLALKPKDNSMLTAATSNGVFLWSLKEGSAPERLSTPLSFGDLNAYESGHPTDLKYNQDGSRLAAYSATSNGRTAVWEVDIRYWQDQACSMVGINSNTISKAREFIKNKEAQISSLATGRSVICPNALLEEAHEAWLQGDIQKSSSLRSEARNLVLSSGESPYIQPYHVNALCWESLMYEADPRNALPICEKGVELAPDEEKDFYRDNLGVAKALNGNLKEAMGEFEGYIKWNNHFLKEYPKNSAQRKILALRAEKRESWMEHLRSGRNPFDRKTLDELRRE